MQKAYDRINWENYPSDKTPINETNLNKIDVALDEVDNRVITHEQTKLDKTTAYGMVKDVTFNEDTGVFTITKLNGSTFTIDTKLEKLAVNFRYDSTNQRLIILLDDGTEQYVDMAALITQYEFLDSATLTFTLDESSGKITATIKKGSITGDMLEPNYLANVTVQAEIATQKATDATKSAEAAALSETNAHESEINAKASEVAANLSERNAASSKNDAKNYMTKASDSADSASASAIAAASSAAESAKSEINAKNSEISAGGYANNASVSENVAATKASEAATSAENAAESEENAQYYAEQAKNISESFAGALRPMGTVTFANLPALSSAVEGDMYNVSDSFTTTASFKEGSGNVIPAGSNVYKTADGYWDVLAGSPVTGVKGNKETTYRRGNVNITPANIGAVATGAISSETVTFTTHDSSNPTAWENMPLLSSGGTLESLISSISRVIKNVRFLFKLLGTTDISSEGDGTVTGILKEILDKLTWKQLSVGNKGVGSVDLPEDFSELSIKVNINSMDIILKIHVIAGELSVSKVQSFRAGYRQSSTEGCGVIFNISTSSLALANAYLNSYTPADVAAATAWAVYYR